MSKPVLRTKRRRRNWSAGLRGEIPPRFHCPSHLLSQFYLLLIPPIFCSFQSTLLYTFLLLQKRILTRISISGMHTNVKKRIISDLVCLSTKMGKRSQLGFPRWISFLFRVLIALVNLIVSLISVIIHWFFFQDKLAARAQRFGLAAKTTIDDVSSLASARG